LISPRRGKPWKIETSRKIESQGRDTGRNRWLALSNRFSSSDLVRRTKLKLLGGRALWQLTL
jgi:hypothetical protein